jgi:hypothetical protein
MKPLALAEKAGACERMVAKRNFVVNRSVEALERGDRGRMRTRNLRIEQAFEPQTGKTHPVIPKPCGLGPTLTLQLPHVHPHISEVDSVRSVTHGDVNTSPGALQSKQMM